MTPPNGNTQAAQIVDTGGSSNEHFLRAAEFSITIGTYDVLELMLQRGREHLQKHATDSERAWFQALIKKLAAARQIEAIHGRCCLLNLNHPALQRQIKRDYIPADYIAAARKFRPVT